ncbi:MAG: HRDC domain-containing protein [bacterium]
MHLPSNGNHSTYVDTTAGVRELALVIEHAERVALDTEADSLHHYYEKVCLLQLSIGENHYIVDPLSPADLGALMDVLARRPLIIHGPDYDLRLLRRHYGFRPCEIFDTMTAARLLGYKRFGLAALVEQHFGVRLPKKGQKADWSSRPLSDALLAYAVADTKYLEPLAGVFEAELVRTNRLAWHRQICRKIIEQSFVETPPSDPERLWRVKGWYVLKSPRALAILRELWGWRESEAQRADRPPFRVMSNECLIKLAAWAEHNTGFDTAPKLPVTCKARRLETLKIAIRHARNLPENRLPSARHETKGGRVAVDDALVEELKCIRDQAAADAGLEPSLVAPAGAIAAIARHRPATASELMKIADLQDWQISLIGKAYLKAVASRNDGIPNGSDGQSARNA